MIQYRHPNWKIRINYNFPRPYGFTRKIIEEENSEQALNLLKEYLNKKWYQGSRDAGWYDLHKQNIKIMWDTGPLNQVLFVKLRDWIINS